MILTLLCYSPLLCAMLCYFERKSIHENNTYIAWQLHYTSWGVIIISSTTLKSLWWNPWFSGAYHYGPPNHIRGIWMNMNFNQPSGNLVACPWEKIRCGPTWPCLFKMCTFEKRQWSWCCSKFGDVCFGITYQITVPWSWSNTIKQAGGNQSSQKIGKNDVSTKEVSIMPLDYAMRSWM